ncbi:MAG: hypothetical protein O2955_11755 [Planctomycetota bacterium]|nr:hypothetical protein [Planctomycetota bacterium]MDA1213185.1 hypothetical protein [Planctomycetota bacterium]
MISKHTTLILGAGASHPYGFPTGRDLYTRVCQSRLFPSPQQKIHEQIIEGKFRNFREQLAMSGQQSVDSFLEHRKELLETGKQAIACELIKLEDENRLFSADSNVDWYRHLFSAMNAPLKQIVENKLAIVTFNYDRSLEHFLVVSIENTHRIARNEAWEIVKKIPIIHVYGSLGRYSPDGKEGRPYDISQSLTAINQCVEELKIVHEQYEQEFIKAHEQLSRTEQVVILGFAFHELNVLRLGFDRIKEGTTIYATAFGMTKKECDKAKSFVGRRLEWGNRFHDSLTFLRESIDL